MRMILIYYVNEREIQIKIALYEGIALIVIKNNLDRVCFIHLIHDVDERIIQSGLFVLLKFRKQCLTWVALNVYIVQ